MKEITIDIEDLKTELPLQFVMEHYGHQPASIEGSRALYYSPFREDSNPSFALYVDQRGIPRWGDFPEGTSGSVVDLVQRFMGDVPLKEAMPQVRDLYREYLSASKEGWEEVKTVDSETQYQEEYLKTALKESLLHVISEDNHILEYLQKTRPSLTLQTLRDFDVRDGGDYLCIPYPDNTAIKKRYIDRKMFVAGSRPGLYYAPGYGVKDQPYMPVILVEGETDTWTGFEVFKDTHTVLGVMSGSYNKNENIELLANKEIVLAFDADEAGRKYSKSWADILIGHGCKVYVLTMEEDRDLSSYTFGNLREKMAGVRQVRKNLSRLKSSTDGYRMEVKDKPPYLVCNWSLKVIGLYAGHEDHSYVCKVIISGVVGSEEYVLDPSDVNSVRSISTWCRQFSGSWWGPPNAVQMLVSELEEQASYVATTATVDRPELVKSGGFALPNLSINTAVKLRASKQRTEEFFSLTWPSRDKINCDVEEVISSLYHSHQAYVTTPILAWLAAAPIKSLFPRFPILFVTGAPGSGKTTLLERFIGTVSNVRSKPVLTSTTPYAVSGRVGSTNCLTVWFDEYRYGAGKLTMVRMDQTLRDSYTSQASYRGGMRDDKTKVTTLGTDAPLVVSGENLPDEQSHRDRLIRVTVPMDDELKGTLPPVVDGSFAYLYLHWLAYSGYLTSPPEVSTSKYKQLGLNERKAYNMGVLDMGWKLLLEFLRDATQEDSVTYLEEDWSTVLQMVEEDTDDRIIEFLHTLYEMWGNSCEMWTADGLLYVSPSLVTIRAKRDGVHVFKDYSDRALSSHLTLNRGGVKTEPTSFSTVVTRNIRYISIPLPLGWST